MEPLSSSVHPFFTQLDEDPLDDTDIASTQSYETEKLNCSFQEDDISEEVIAGYLYSLKERLIQPPDIEETNIREVVLFQAMFQALEIVDLLTIKQLWEFKSSIPKTSRNIDLNQAILKWPSKPQDQVKTILAYLKEHGWNLTSDLTPVSIKSLFNERLIEVGQGKIDLNDSLFSFIDLLCSFGLDLKQVDCQGQNLIWLIYLQTNPNFFHNLGVILGYLVSKRLDVNSLNHKGEHLLQVLMSRPFYEERIFFLNQLLIYTKEINQKNRQGYTCLSYTLPLHQDYELATSLDEVECLIKAGCHVGVKWIYSEEPFIYRLICLGQFDLLKSLFPYLGCLTGLRQQGCLLLNDLARCLDIPDRIALQWLIKEAAYQWKKADLSLEELDQEGLAPIHWAARMRDLKTLQFLSSITNPCILTSKQETILHLAVQTGEIEIVQNCLNAILASYPSIYSAFINAQNERGETALHMAAACHETVIVRCLLKANIDPALKTEDKKTAFDVAKDKFDLTLMKELCPSLEWGKLALCIWPDLSTNLDSLLKDKETLALQIHCLFFNSDLKDVKELLLGLLHEAKEESKQELSTLLIQISGGFFTWGGLISRFPTSEQQTNIRKKYGNEPKDLTLESYVKHQVEFGIQHFEKILTIYIEWKEKPQTFDLWTLLNRFAHIRFEVESSIGNQKEARQFREWRYGFVNFLKQKYPQHSLLNDSKFFLFDLTDTRDYFKTAISKFPYPKKYSYNAFTSVIEKNFNDLNSNSNLPLMRKNNYSSKAYQIGYLVQDQAAKQTLALTHVLFNCTVKNSLKETHSFKRGLSWHHPELKGLFPLIEEVIYTHSLLIEQIHEKELIVKNLWKLSHAMLTKRGFGQISWMWYLFICLRHKRLPSPSTIAATIVNCHLISKPLSVVLQEFPSYFEGNEISIEKIDTRAHLEMELGRKFLFD